MARTGVYAVFPHEASPNLGFVGLCIGACWRMRAPNNRSTDERVRDPSYRRDGCRRDPHDDYCRRTRCDQSAPNVPTGSQGYFKAIKAGQTKLYATSDPPCRSASPPCMLPTLFLEIPI